MRESLFGTVWRLAIFVLVAVLGMFALLTIFAQFRFERAQSYHALFTNVTGLKSGNFVRIAGVEVGKVQRIALGDDGTVTVSFTAEDSVVLTEGSRVVIRYDDLIGGRYVALEQGPGSAVRLAPGSTIPLDRTAPALDLDALIGGFRPLFRALDPEQVNALSGQLIRAFQGEGVTVSSVLAQTATLTHTLADRDQLIGQVITNLNTVLDSFGSQRDQFSKAIGSLAELTHGLAERKTEIGNWVTQANASSASIADLLYNARPPIRKVLHETDRTAGIVVADHEYVDNLLATLPETYRVLGRQGMYGDYFSFYMCELILKVNGKGGQPVYVKLAGQDSGRCTPR
ncbi:MCE family protein [Mycolicibacterium sp.]|uniref:MCE family protein n=1 Tax=Mycolicibacterium sp. TaxID=2320850 RepID=UPI0037C9ECAF